MKIRPVSSSSDITLCGLRTLLWASDVSKSDRVPVSSLIDSLGTSLRIHVTGDGWMNDEKTEGTADWMRRFESGRKGMNGANSDPMSPMEAAP